MHGKPNGKSKLISQMPTPGHLALIMSKLYTNCILFGITWTLFRGCDILLSEVMDMKKTRERSHSNSIVRIGLVGISVLIQALWMLLTVSKLNEYYAWISLVMGALSALVVLKLYSRNTTAAMKMPWILLILIFPVMGVSLYLMVEILGDSGGMGKRLRLIRQELGNYRQQEESVLPKLEENPAIANQFRYLRNCGCGPVQDGTAVTYYPEGKLALEALKEALEQAESFIFMEYFIVEDGSAFREIRDVLVRKARKGVEVRLLYDDFGSIGYVNLKFARELNAQGIHCRIFNPAVPVVNLIMNHRDHRKITVIDGKVAFTGGYNLADEYFDRTHPYGKWKDTGIRLEGAAVNSLTATFLELWYATTRQREDYGRYFENACRVEGDCAVLPFGDNPMEEERLAENVFLNLAAQAKKTLWFMTPYLILSDEMTRALGLAAKRGVDVRIVVPGIPDKKAVYQVSRSYFPGLASQGVRIYTYTPGFCHGKMGISDGELACIGTSNLDFRSLYHHFENNVLLYGGKAVADIQLDFEETFLQSREVTDQYRTGRGAVLMVWQCLLRLFSPLI